MSFYVQKLLPQIKVGSSLSLQHDVVILEHVKKFGSITDRVYATLTKEQSQHALDFKKLCTLGLLVRHGAGRSTYYTFFLCNTNYGLSDI